MRSCCNSVQAAATPGSPYAASLLGCLFLPCMPACAGNKDRLTTKPAQSWSAYTSAPALYRCITIAWRGMGRIGAAKGRKVVITYQKFQPAAEAHRAGWCVLTSMTQDVQLQHVQHGRAQRRFCTHGKTWPLLSTACSPSNLPRFAQWPQASRRQLRPPQAPSCCDAPLLSNRITVRESLPGPATNCMTCVDKSVL